MVGLMHRNLFHSGISGRSIDLCSCCGILRPYFHCVSEWPTDVDSEKETLISMDLREGVKTTESPE